MRHLSVLLMLGLVAVAGADDIVVGAGRTHAFRVEEATTLAEPVRVSDRAVLEKTGAGTLAIPAGVFAANTPVALDVREGTVRLEPSAPLVASYPQPTEVLGRAALWMDAGANVRLRDGSADEVAAWHDVRETGDGSEANPFVYTRAVAFTNDWLTAFPLRQDYLEKTGVYCRGFGSGCFLNWVKPDAAQQNLTGIRHAFVVHGGPTARGHFLGQRRTAGKPYFQRGSGDLVWMPHNAENLELHASRTYLNGAEVDAFSAYYPAKSRHVVEVEALGQPLGAMCFYNDRDMQLKTTAGTNMANNAEGKAVNAILGISAQTEGGNRAGGDYLHEVVLFTNALTAAERQAVSDWLNQKWRDVPPPAALPPTTVSLATNAVLELSGDLPTTVSVRGDGVLRKTGEGTATVRSFAAPRNAATRVEVLAGKLNLGYALPLVCAAGDTLTSECRYWGPELAPPQKGAVTSRLVKNGSGPVTLDAIPDGVTNLVVNGGELRLADPERLRLAVPTVSPAVVIPDADFEGYPASSHTAAYSYIANGATVRGWHAVVPGLMGESKADSAVFFFDQGKGSPSGWNMVMQDEPGGVLVVKNNASAWCEVEVPASGEYVLSFRAAPRSGYSGEQLDVMMGPDTDALVSLGTFKTTAYAWRPFVFEKIRLEAGVQQLWLKSKTLNTDRCTQFDDFSLVRVEETDVWVLPNGGFERHADGFNATTFTTSNAKYVPGFEMKQCDDVGTADEGSGGLFANSSFTSRGVNGDQFFNRPWSRPDSETQCFLSGNGSQLTATFTPPAGTWRFRADFCRWCVTWRSGTSYIVSADLDVGGAAVALGAVTNASQKLLPVDWPNAFTVDGATPVTLTLTGAVAPNMTNGHGLLDNLALVRAASPGVNLFKEGGFETMTPWQVVVTPKPNAVGGSARIAYDTFYHTYFGLEHFEGQAGFKLVNDDVLAQAVTFPAGGLYRLSANMESRSTPGSRSFGNGQNPIAFFLARGGVTNWLGVTDSVTLTNFHEYACIVRVPEGGTYDVGFRGRSVWGGAGASTVDRTTILDAAQLYAVETEKPIDLPEHLELTVAAGARLTLDFDGTNEVRSLCIAGKTYVGVVSLAERPELLGTLNGRGALFIRPRGTVLLFR